MAETRNNAGREDGSSFTRVLNGLNGLKQSVDKSVRRTDDVLRKYNSAKMTDDGKERAAILSKTQKTPVASVTKKDVSEAVSTANESTAKRLNDLFGEVKTASVKPVSVSQKQTDVGKQHSESVKNTTVKQVSASTNDTVEAVRAANENTTKKIDDLFGEFKTASAKKVVSFSKAIDVGKVESVKKIPVKVDTKIAESAKNTPVKADNNGGGKAAIAAALTSAVAAGVAKAIPKKSGSSSKSAIQNTSSSSQVAKPSKNTTAHKASDPISDAKGQKKPEAKKSAIAKKQTGKTKTQERLEELFGEAKERSNASAARLDELFGQANTKLTGVDKNINAIKEPILKKLSMNIGEKLLQLVMSPPGLLMIAFVAGFIKGWLDQQPWFQFVKKLLKSKIVGAILGGTAIALLLNHLTGGLLGMVAKPLLGLLGKGIGKLLLKGIPMLLKGGLGLVKGLAGMLMNPVGAGIAALAAGIAIGYAGFKFISNKLQAMREEETKKINEKASTFSSNDKAKEQNKGELEKLKAGDGNEQYMQVSNGKGGFDMVKGHFDADGNFVIVEKMDSGGEFKAVEPDTAGIQAADVAKQTKKMSFNWIAQSKKGITRVQFGQIEAPVKRAFMQYVDKNYCQTGELPKGTSTKLMSALLQFSAHYSVEGEGLNNDDGEAGLKKQLAETWETLNQVVKCYEPGFERLRQFVENYKIVYGKIVGYMVPKSNRGAIMAAVSEEKFLFEKNYLQSDDWNHIAFAATVYQIWLDIFLGFMNKEFKTDFRSNTITKAEYDEAMGNDKGVQSQALALSTSLATQVRTDNADKAKREAVKIEAAKKRAAANVAKKNKGEVQKVANQDGTFSYKHSDGTDATPEEIEEYKKKNFEPTEDKQSSPFSKSAVTMDALVEKLDEINKNSKQAADNSKRAEQAGTAAAVTSAMGAKKGVGDGRSATGAKVK